MRNPLTLRRLRYHTTDANTVALWQGYDGLGLVDSSGNGLTLTLGGGTLRYAEIGHGLHGFLFDGATYLKRAGNDASLNITGDMTIEAIVRPLLGTAAFMVDYGAAGEVGANDNHYWSMGTSAGTIATTVLSNFFWETGAGVNQSKDDPIQRTINEAQHWAWVRTGTTLIPYCNGYAQTAITGITNGTVGGAPTQVVSVGGDSAGASLFTGIIASIKISNVARSASYVRKDAARCMGMGPGILDATGEFV